ncbi:hypothetical protein GGI26_005055 [Coemansia sp. RSA 1358]|uniref:NmrA-like domain-containing protein n=1 Tax=Coemansia umbellata TaxID=1424467 RepID=A0ABQ8PI57_9FUNG|nr:hypothetical protein EDC05_004703 [Coemansia umbellata]KAJ2620346.1 hypothetical protein GGI26_005055 [Coemansia sp. RSA 1358]
MTQTAAIIGATGIQGGSVLRALHKTGKYNIVAITRNASSISAKTIKQKYPDVELAEANTDDVGSLKKAFKGADIVFGVTKFSDPEVLARIGAGDLDAEYKQGKNIIDAAIAAGVDKVIYSSLPSANKISGGKYPDVLLFDAKNKVEQYLWSKASKIRGATVQMGFYMENFVNFSSISAEDSKTVEFNFPVASSTKFPLVDTANDAGGVVAYILSHFDEFVGKPFEVSGGYYSIQEMVEAFQQVTRKPARHVPKSLPFVESNIALLHMFNSNEEFGYFGGKVDFLEVNKNMDYKFTTPVEYWKNRAWAGPSQ